MNTTPAAVRDENYERLRARLAGDRARVYDAWSMWGPATTRRMAELAGMDLLSLRPRTTELAELGLVECVGREGHDGVYRAVPIQEALRRQAEAAAPRQLALL